MIDLFTIYESPVYGIIPLSRHFYTVDELYAALTYCTRRNDTIETLFWCQELILSGYISETISTLFEAWLWNKGPFCLAWLRHATTLRSEELVAEDILIAAYQLSAIPYDKQDHSLWNILVLSSETPDRVTPKTPPWTMKDMDKMDEKELYFIRALYQGKAQSAWWMAQQMEEKRVWAILAIYATHQYATSYDSIWEALQQYEHLLGYRTAEYDKIILCVAVLSCCISVDQEKNNNELPIQLPSIQQHALQRWSEKEGRKERRIYSIPTACLYGTTQRGRTPWSHTNVKELNWIEGSLIGCPFWEEAIAEYGTIVEGVIQWRSDDDLEAFYDRYFPDDIPDEWTKAEKAKSHGDGILGPTESVQLYKYSRSAFSKWSRLAWNTRDRVLTTLHKNNKWNGQLSSIVSHIIIKEAMLSPVHRKKIRQ